MEISSNIRLYYRRIRRAVGGLRARLRHARVTVALLAMLMLALGEPLLCIIHCQIWIPFAYQGYFATQHVHMHHTSQHVSAEAAAATGTLAIVSPLPENVPTCFMLSAADDHTGVPFHVPPSPVHDLLAAAVYLILLVICASLYLALALRAPPNAPRPLLLRPPIPFVA